MNVQAFKNQLLHDLKASWQKTALLALLFSVGLCFWIPPLVRAIKKKAPHPVAVAAPQSVGISVAGGSSAAAGMAGQTDPKKVEFTWERGERLLRTAALVRSVDVAALRGDPFKMDRDQFPPPVLFEEEPFKAPIAAKPQAEIKPPSITDAKLAEKLVLKSTIVSAKRRAAFINDKLYYEGREIQVDGQTYVLSVVSPRKVLLKQGTATFELIIPSAFGSNSIGVQSIPK